MMHKLISKFQLIFRSLKYENFRLYVLGILISQIGIWIQNIAINWYIYCTSNSSFILGIATFINTIPYFIITPFAGVIIDKLDRQKLLLYIQIMFFIQALLMLIMILLHKEDITKIVILGFLLNSICAIDIPLRQSTFIYLIKNKDDLCNAISINSSCFNIAKLLGPAIAGFLIVNTPLYFCIFINFLCMIPIIYFVKRISLNQEKQDNIPNKNALESIKDGFKYIINSQKITFPLLFIFMFSLLGMSYPVLIPILTKSALNLNADTFGFLMGMAGLGALYASLNLASANSLEEIKTNLCRGVIAFSLSYICIGFTSSIIILAIAMFYVGFGTISTITSNLSLIQSTVIEHNRGKVMSMYTICLMGATSISNFLAGTTSELIGISYAFILFGIILILVTIVLFPKISSLNFDKNATN